MPISRHILIAFLSFPCILGYSKTIEVIQNNNQANPIANAVANAQPGDTLLLMSGRYMESGILITQPITIYSNRHAIVDAQDNAEDIFIIKSNNVTIQGLTLVNVGVSFLKEAAAIRLVHCENAWIQNNSIDSCFFGIYIEQANCSIISNNKIIGAFSDEASAGNAIHAWKARDLYIYNNTTQRHRDGIYFEFVNNSLIENNTSQYNIRYGLHFMFSHHDEYKNNVFESNGAGVAVMFSHHIVMAHNKFLNNWGGASYGLLLKEISDALIHNNDFVKNTIGVLAEGANRIEIRSNEFKLNGTALDIKGNCLENKIVQNNFIANTYEVVTNTKYNNNTFLENYWSNYSGYDYDRDGHGDFAYRPVNLFAKVTSEVPSASFLLHSPLVKLIELNEKVFPQFIPESLIDERPIIKPYVLD